MKSLRKLVLGMVGMLAVVGWSQSCDSVDAAFDCQSVCTRYRDCYDSNYDVGACRDRCRSDSANNANIRHDADTCEACIGGMSCLASTFNCASSCGAIRF